MFCLNYFMLSYKYFYPKDFLACEDHTFSEFASNQNMSDISVPQTFMLQDQKSFVDPDSLSDKWLIGRQQAQQTIQVTTQSGIC